MIDLLQEIKVRLSITGDYHDELLSALAIDVKDFMLSSGVSAEVVESAKSVGVIARGVADLWNMGSGEGKYSEVFFQRVSQLVLERSL